MKKFILVFVVGVLFSSLAMAQMSRFNNVLPSCEELGYVRHKEVSTQAIFCPFDNEYSVNIDNNYRGYVEKEQLEADYAAYGKPEDFCVLEEVVQGEGNSARTLYRCKECKTLAFEAGLCVEYCDVKKFPYSSKPEELYGQVIECKDSNGVRYAYSFCNNGWKADGARCVMTIADRNYYPYFNEPDKKRGDLDVFKSATNLYYGYKRDTCSNGYSFVARDASYNTGLCVKNCEISNCREVSETEGIKNYKCDFSDDCIVGDNVLYNGIKIGMLLHRAKSSSESNLVVASKASKAFGMYGGHLDLPYDTGKSNTKKIVEYCSANGFSCPAAEYCYNYSINEITEPALAKGQWFLPSKEEARNLIDNDMYVVAIYNQYSLPVYGFIVTSNSSTIYRPLVWSTSNFVYTNEANKDTAYSVFPMLAI